MLHRKRTRRMIAATLLLVMLTNTLAPTVTYALTSGPTQPEATSFEPVDTTDMVNLQTGDLTYNVPLLEVPGPEGGYPLALSYHAGITTNQDASWVGLGWSLNAGAITRSVNGYPDDFNIDNSNTRRDYWSSGESKTIGISVAYSRDNVSFGLSISWNSHKGFNGDASVGYNFGTIFEDKKLGLHQFNKFGSVSLSGSGISASFLNHGLSYNFESRGLTFSAIDPSSSLGISMSTSGTFSAQLGGVTGSISNASQGRISTSGVSIPIPIGRFTISLNYFRSYSDETSTNRTIGSLNMNGNTPIRTSTTSPVFTPSQSNMELTNFFDTYTLPDKSLVDAPEKYVGGTLPDFDAYNVTAQGLGGSIRPYLYQGYLLGPNIYKYTAGTIFNPAHYEMEVIYGVGSFSNTIPHKNPKFRFINDFSNTYRQNNNLNYSSADYWNPAAPFDASPVYGNDGGISGYNTTSAKLAGSKNIEFFTIADLQNFSDRAARGYLNPTSIGSGAILPQSAIKAFTVTNESGVRYHYSLPVYAFAEELYNEKIDQSNGLVWNNHSKPQLYAYEWLLSAVTGPDYVDRNQNEKADEGDWGYWVAFDYTRWGNNYFWRNPAENFRVDIDNEFKSASKGKKEIYYLTSVKTRTHTALFQTSERLDGRGAANAIFNSNNHAGAFDNTSATTARLDKVYLVNNADAASTDLPGVSLKSVELLYDYSLAPGTINSFATSNPSAKSGKLTLKQINVRGKEHASLLPPMKFDYELSPEDQVAGSITMGNNTTGWTGLFTSTTDFTEGDILTFDHNSSTHNVVLTKKTALTGNNKQYDFIFLTNPVYGIFTASAHTTKNPVYKQNNYDVMGYYKSDYISDNMTSTPVKNESIRRRVSTVSSKSTDAWNLRKITTALGAEVKMEYEADTYQPVIKSAPFLQFENATYDPGTQKLTFHILDVTDEINNYLTSLTQTSMLILLMKSIINYENHDFFDQNIFFNIDSYNPVTHVMVLQTPGLHSLLNGNTVKTGHIPFVKPNADVAGGIRGRYFDEE